MWCGWSDQHNYCVHDVHHGMDACLSLSKYAHFVTKYAGRNVECVVTRENVNVFIACTWV